LVGSAEAGSIPSQAFEFPKSDDGGDRLTSASQVNLDAGFGLVDDAGEAAPGLSDGILMGHTP